MSPKKHRPLRQSSGIFLLMCVLFAIVGLVFLSGKTAPAMADASPSMLPGGVNLAEANCIPLDIVFLVDQSEGMRLHDPTNARIQAIQYLLNIMAYDRMFVCPNQTNRMGVISFGKEEVKEIFPLKPVDASIAGGLETGLADWKKVFGEQSSKLNSGDNNSRFSHNFIPAYRKAHEWLKAASQLPGVRKKIVVLMTDGAFPCKGETDPGNNTASCSPHNPTRTIMPYNELIAEIKAKSAPFDTFKNDEGPFVWVYSWPASYYLVSKEDSKKVAEGWGEKWKSDILGTRGLGEAKSKFTMIDPEKPRDIVEKLINDYLAVSPHPQLQRAGCARISVSPLTERAVLLIWNEGGKSQIQLKSPANPLDPIASTDPVADLDLHAPRSGEWNIACGGGNDTTVMVYWQSFLATTITADIKGCADTSKPCNRVPQFDEPTSSLNYNPDIKFNLKANVVDSITKIKLSETNVAAELKYEVTIPGQGKTPPKNLISRGNGDYESEEPLPVKLNGLYSVHIFGDVPRGDGGKRPLNEITYSYEVYPVNPVRLEFGILATPKDTLTIHKGIFDKLDYNATMVQVRLVDARENKIPVEVKKLITSNASNAIVMKLRAVGGYSEYSWPLYPSSVDPYALEGEIGNKPIPPGKYEIFPEVTGGIDITRYRISPTRAETVTIMDNPLTNPATWRAVWYVFHSILVVLLGILVVFLTNPVKGTLQFGWMRADANGEFNVFAPVGSTIELMKNAFHRRRVAKYDPKGKTPALFEVSPLLSHIKNIRANMESDGQLRVRIQYENGKDETKTLKADELVKLREGLRVQYSHGGEASQNRSLLSKFRNRRATEDDDTQAEPALGLEE